MTITAPPPRTSLPTRAGQVATPGRLPSGRPDPGGRRRCTPAVGTRSAAGEIVPRSPKRDAEHVEWDRLRFQTALSRRAQHMKRGIAPRANEDLPDPYRPAGRIVTAAAEALSGHRPVDQLARWTTPEMFEALARRAGLARRLLGDDPDRRRPWARSVRTQITLSGNCEAAVLLDDGTRVRPAAALLIPHRGRWILSVLEIG